ncbi:ABC transporter permease [Lactobacillus sp. DCY120]|uniref:ABC transporter permease n=1 Tax=Bombilactobacillus apium TaxID=2675299 RepID=A0A850QYK2_9LACO|nr:YhgE/Pip family protein [Bombilactobacillus apium]NVY95799.1 ABC transporter permease [Bombilactobacillus apium]
MKKIYKLTLIITIMALIPVIYSSLFLGALEDPYGRLDTLPVAVVNTDQDANPVYHRLIKAKIFDYKLESSTKAQKDLQNGDVYAVVRFDKDFKNKMQNFVRTSQSPKIQLTTSEGLSYSTTKMVRSAIEQFTDRVNHANSQLMIVQLQARHIPLPANISSVIQLKNNDIHPVKNNGEAMTPYILSLTLFVGGIFVNQFVMRKFAKKGDDLPVYWMKQFLLPLFISVCQVGLLLLFNQLFIHISIDKFWGAVPFLLLVAATFCSIIVAFNKLIPGIGSLIVLLLTMLQTSSSGGAYTIALSAPFFQTIHQFLPMTYSVAGLRKLISLNTYNVWPEVGILLLFFIGGQIILLLAYHKHENRLFG